MLRVGAGISAALVFAAFALGGGPAPTHARAEAPAPNPPSATAAYAGADGVLVTWQIPRGGSAPNGYEIQRGDAAEGPFTEVAAVGADTLRWQDLTALANHDYTYRVLATADGATSLEGPRRQVHVPDVAVLPGSTNAFEIQGPPGSPWEKDLTFTDSQLTVTRLTDTTFSVHGVSDASSPQGAQEVAFTIGSVSGDQRINGATATVGPEAVQSKVPVLYPTTVGLCGVDRAGTLTVNGGSFSADGTPLGLDATFTYCGATGHLEWHSQFGYQRVVPAVSRIVVADGQILDVEFRNTGYLALMPQRAQIDNFSYGIASPGWFITKDACDGQWLYVGKSCLVTIARNGATAQQAHLVLNTVGFGQRGNPEVVLATGPDVPAPPTFDPGGAAGTPDGIAVGWIDRPADPPITGYTIYRQLPNSLDYAEFAQIGPDVHGRWIDHVPYGGSYAVAARNALGEGPRSVVNSSQPVDSGQLEVTPMWNTGTDRDLAVVAGLPLRLTTDGGDHAEPSFDSQTRHLVYAATTDGVGPDDYDLWVRPNILAPSRRLTQDPSSSDRRPVLSSDGATVAFARYVNGTPSIWTVPFTGGAATQIPGTNGDSDPSWAPNGNVLAVSHRTDTGSRIDIVNLAGSYRRVLVDIPGKPAIRPSWANTNSEPTVQYVRVGDINRNVPVNALTGEQNENSAPVAPSDGASDYDERLIYPYGISAYSMPTYVRPVKAVTSVLNPTGATLSWQQGKVRDNPGCFECAHWTIVRRSEANGAAPQQPTDGVAVYDGPATSTPLTGLATGAVYRLTLFAFNSIGDMTTKPVSWGVQPAVVPSGPVVSTTSADGPNLMLSWAALPSATGLYQVEVGTRALDAAHSTYAAAITYQPFSSGAATRMLLTATPGTTYYVHVRVIDQWGGTTAWGPVSTVVNPYDDRAFTPSKGWASLRGQKGYFADTLRQSSTIGATLGATFYASSLALIGDVCPTCGKVGIYVDGKLLKTVDTYAKTAASRHILWSLSFPTVGKHVVNLVVVSTPKRQTVRIDAVSAGHS